MPTTRSSLCRKRTRDESFGQCNDGSHMTMIVNLKREILELNRLLDSERKQLTETLCERASICPARVKQERDCKVNERQGRDAVMVNETHTAYRNALHELELCKKDLEDTREALREACEEREALRVSLSESRRSTVDLEKGTESGARKSKTEEESHPHLDWVGRHYLAVSLPEDRMFKPGQSVTPIGVLQKLFEMRVGDRHAQAFSLLLENVNIILCQREPEWYAKHFGFRRAYVRGDKYKVTDRVDTEDFAWLLFEYGAHTPLIEVLAGLQSVLNNSGKGGVTNAALYTIKNAYSSYSELFREIVSGGYERFTRVRDRAQRVRKESGVIHVPLTAGLTVSQSGECQQGGSNCIKSRVLRSVLEGIESPPSHVSSTPASKEEESHEDPLHLGRSIEELMNRGCPGSQGKVRTSSIHRRDRNKAETSSFLSGQPIEKRVLFESPWANVCV